MAPAQAGGSRYYKTFPLTSLINEAACLSLTFTTTACNGGTSTTDLIRSAVYNGSFDPANVSTNQITAAGSSPTPGTPISYQVSANAGQALVVAVYATNHLNTCSQFGLAVTSNRPWATATPKILSGDSDVSGQPVVVQTSLTAQPASWTATVANTYQWRSCDAAGGTCADIPGATGSTFSPDQSLVGSTLRVVNTATDASGTSSSTSAQTGVVTAAPPEPIAAPDTLLTKSKIKPAGAKFKFEASGSSTGFECRLKRKHHKPPPFKACSSPAKYKNLKPGKYTFAVRAVGPGGTDASAATDKFKIE